MVKALVDAGVLEVVTFPFEQRSRRVTGFVPGSGATWAQANLSWDEDVGSWADDEPSEMFATILNIVGQRVDAQHLDSAYKAGCELFLTSDKGDIWSKRVDLHALIGITVVHTNSEAARLRDIVGAPAEPSTHAS